MNNIFDNIFKTPKTSKTRLNNVTLEKNLNNLFNSNNKQEGSVSMSKSSNDNNELMTQIDKLNEKIISYNKQNEQLMNENKQNEQLMNENKVLRANLEGLMRRFNLRFN